ncbi:hypothetical protein [Gaopeijia maritima]|uniref:Uncharacterized protein n=1 Tax=Gaopeijia maritima TaxID=3119007 RepID=A0ABU9EDC6_9BACT
MWLMTPFGFFSTVKKPGDDHLTVRARSASDLDRLRADYLPQLGPTVEGAGTDYPYRAVVGGEAYAEALAAIARDIDYANFKSEVSRRMGRGRSHIYSEVWTALLEIEREG